MQASKDLLTKAIDLPTYGNSRQLTMNFTFKMPKAKRNAC